MLGVVSGVICWRSKNMCGSLMWILCGCFEVADLALIVLYWSDLSIDDLFCSDMLLAAAVVEFCQELIVFGIAMCFVNSDVPSVVVPFLHGVMLLGDTVQAVLCALAGRRCGTTNEVITIVIGLFICLFGEHMSLYNIPGAYHAISSSNPNNRL